MITLIVLFCLNIALMVFLWHMDVQHNLDRLGEAENRGLLRGMRPDEAYRLAQYGLVTSLLLIDILFVFSFFRTP